MDNEKNEYCRRNDVAVAQMTTEFKDFVERYERDVSNSQTQMTEILLPIKSHDEFKKSIKPIYAKGMMALGAAVLGSIGIAISWVWKHVNWGP